MVETSDCGRALLLDGQVRSGTRCCFNRTEQVQLSEADSVYTASLLGELDYDGAEVLILGGGDGALLASLLQPGPAGPKPESALPSTDLSGPAQVTMVELDGRVMEVVREWMPGVAGGALDCQVGERHNIVTGSKQSTWPQYPHFYGSQGDAVQYLEDCQEDGRQFDFIFGDLTDVPIEADGKGEKLARQEC